MNNTNNRIAIIGMACRFPGARNLDEYWDNLIAGKDSIKHFTEDELSKFEFDFEKLKSNPDYVKARGILEDIEYFDSGFFGMTPKEAAETDPQHRLWLETSWDAFENAGCDPTKYKGAIGVYAGAYYSTYLLNNILRDPKKLENFIRLRSTESYQILTGNDPSFISTKTAYKFNLKGPAINIQTACSTSLVAIAQACQSLFSFESDICLAGGICVSTPQESGYVFQEGAIPSPDGVCRPFDSRAEGTVPSNGVGTVILKRVEDAIRDGDMIYAVVSGWGLNNDGSNKVSYTAPSVDGQAEAISMAQTFAEVNPEDISYIEAHGTATQLGDPVEIAALTKAFNRKTNKKQFCGIGSVKSNIGHTDAAAGVASFIKTCLAAYHRKIPPTIHFSEPNQHIDFKNSPFFVQKKLKEWSESKALIMGVSSFGIGGTNAHVIVEEPPEREPINYSESEWPELVLLSAKSKYSLSKRKEELVDYLKTHPDKNIRDVAYTLATGRNHMPHRSFTVASGIEDLISGEDNFKDGIISELNSKIVFMFPGQGAQYVSMGKDLYNSNYLFRKLLDECFNIVKSETGEDLKSILFENTNIDQAEERLSRTEMTQPALFIIEYALARILMQFQIEPIYLIGHSIGEYTAACIAGVFDMTTALKIVIKRGQLMRSMPAGNMMAVRISAEQLKSLDSSSFEIGADNSSSFATISFKENNTIEVKALLKKNNIQYIALNTSHAFHSADFDPILEEFGKYVDQFSLNKPGIPFISCVTGEFIREEQAISGSYWAKQLRNTVLFRKGIDSIAENEDVIFLEVGPNTHLSSLVRQNKKLVNKKTIYSTLGKVSNIEERVKIITALGNLHNIGINIRPKNFFKDSKPRKACLPTYPYDRKRHWIDFNLPEGKNYQQDLHSKSTGTDPLEAESKSEDPGSNNESPGGKNVQIVQSVWKSVIGLEDIGLDEDFFELGGHSLLALQIIARIKEKLSQSISLKTFLENPTINKLCSEFGEQIVPHDTKSEIVQSIDLTNVPLSFNQKRLWIISQLNNANPAYNIPFTYHFKGDLNIEVFRKSINILFERHFVMFSVFKQKNGQPYCEIIPKPVDIDLIDFSKGTPEERRDKIIYFTGNDARKPFNLESDSLYRLYLLKQDDSNFFFHATINHLIFDGWSWSVFIKDLKKIYESLLHNKEIELEEIKTHYFEYFSRLQSDDDEVDEEKSTKFWVENLKDCSPELNFPYDKQRKDIQTGFGEKKDIKISSAATQKLREIAKKENATLFATVLSAMGVLFQKYSGENDICIGTPVAHRPHSSLENIFGMFVNTIPLRLKINEDINFRKFINYTKNVLLDAISHQDLPFEKIVEALNPERSSNINPLFQVSVVWINNSAMPISMTGVNGEHITVIEGVSPFDITFYLWENNENIVGEIEYNIDILKSETIIQLRDNFLNLIGNLVKNPDDSIDSIPMISDEERKSVQGFTETKTDYPRNKTIAELFEEQVDLYPDKKAVVFKKETLSYKQLNEKTNQLAHTLRGLGVVNNTPVGLLVEKSTDMIVGILGILKAGGAYVPIDPEYPEQRINFMIRDAGCKILLTQKGLMEVKVEGVTKLDLNSPDTYHKDTSSVESINVSSDLAYIMYTSGTTGVPKGSLIQQHSVVRLVRNTTYIELTSNDRILLTGAIVFDATTFEIWGALLNGGALYIVEKETILDSKALEKELLKNEITILWLTSPLFTQIAEIRTDIFSKLKYLLVGGDVLSAPHINKVRKDNPHLKVINGYGPTENTTFSTTYLIEKDFEHNVPIGKPVSNSTAYIFDNNMNYQPIGVIGELYVGGDGLSKGYLNRDDLNKSSFIDHPQIPGERLYKTGDRAKWLENGNIEFHGRIDKQLKIRGFRVELEEIETAISEMKGVIETVVKPIKSDEGDTRLAAFLHVSETFSMDTKELNEYLRKKLPHYMIPSAYRLMHEFPKTINGKIDKEALSIDMEDVITRDKQETKSLTPIERKILDVWFDVLKTKDILINDNFFDIGGNSLLAITVFSKIESIFNVELGLRIFFDSPRIIDLAEAIDFAIQKPAEKKQDDKIPHSKQNIISGEI